ncbi:hypothetical protein C8Q73DRAFT_786252 [Cubamyces lactineus]|nr:hypothetical protein C8Q73DRAFT_786252 [Cubamyces lactineus]
MLTSTAPFMIRGVNAQITQQWTLTPGSKWRGDESAVFLANVPNMHSIILVLHGDPPIDVHDLLAIPMVALEELNIHVRTVADQVLPTVYISAGLVPVLTRLVLRNVFVPLNTTLVANLRNLILWASPGLARPILLSQFLDLLLMFEQIEQINIRNYLEVTATDCQSISQPRDPGTKPSLQYIAIRDNPLVIRQILSLLIIPPHVDAIAIAEIDGDSFDDIRIRSDIRTMMPPEPIRPTILPVFCHIDTIHLHMQGDHCVLSAAAVGHGIHLAPYQIAVQGPDACDGRLFSAMVPLVHQFSECPVTTLAFSGNFAATTDAMWTAVFSRWPTVQTVVLEDIRLPGDESSGNTVLPALWRRSASGSSTAGVVPGVVLPNLRSFTLKGPVCSKDLFVHIATCLAFRHYGGVDSESGRLHTLYLELAQCWPPQELAKCRESFTRWARSVTIEAYSAKGMHVV